MTIGNTLKLLRKSKGLQQGFVADKHNITQTYLCLVEKDKKVPSIDLLCGLSKTYEVPLWFIIYHGSPLDNVPRKSLPAFRELKRTVDLLIKQII